MKSAPLLLAAFWAACAPAPPQGPPPLAPPMKPPTRNETGPVAGLPHELEPRSRALVHALTTRDFARIVRELDPKLGAALDATKLELAWNQATASLGRARAFAGVERQRKAGQDVVVVTYAFERGALDVKLVYDAKRRISGLWLSPGWTPPEYAESDRFTERELVVGQEPWLLPATLTLPKATEPVPAVVLVHGSGPHDRDETLGPNKPFKDLAWGLASRGIAVLRYEKRTRAHLDKIRASKAPFTVDDETVNDALAAIALLRSTEGVDPSRVFVLGHSMGGSMLPRIGARDPKLAGLLALAASATPTEDAIVAQFRYIFALDGAIDDSEKKKLAALEQQAQQIRDLKPGQTDGPSVFGAPPAYWLDLRGYDPAASAKKLAQPFFFAQGGRDYQVTDKDFERFKRALKGNKNAHFHYYEGLNHLFMSGRGTITPAEYERAGHVDERVIADIAAFVRGDD